MLLLTQDYARLRCKDSGRALVQSLHQAAAAVPPQRDSFGRPRLPGPARTERPSGGRNAAAATRKPALARAWFEPLLLEDDLEVADADDLFTRQCTSLPFDDLVTFLQHWGE